jgi:uncharacterized damage-inducible protein DinB
MFATRKSKYLRQKWSPYNAAIGWILINHKGVERSTPLQRGFMQEQLTVQPLADYPQPIAEALWRLQDTRRRTMDALKDLPDEAIDWQATGLQNSIGTLLYHIAAIEVDWLYSEVLEQEFTPELEMLLSYPVREDDGRLFAVKEVHLNRHLSRLDWIRNHLLESFKSITAADYRRPRDLPHYDVTPEWVLHHLAQHEAEHRGEILTIRTLYEASLKTE